MIVFGATAFGVIGMEQMSDLGVIAFHNDLSQISFDLRCGCF